MENNEEQIQNKKDWRDGISESLGVTLKIADGESKTFVFLNDGEEKTHPDYGTSIVFRVELEGEEMNFYVRNNNYSFLKDIKALGVLTGQAVTVSRIGSKKSDTRYTIEKVDLPIQEETISEEDLN